LLKVRSTPFEKTQLQCRWNHVFEFAAKPFFLQKTGFSRPFLKNFIRAFSGTSFMAKTTFVNKVMPEAVEFNPNPNDGLGFNENLL